MIDHIPTSQYKCNKCFMFFLIYRDGKKTRVKSDALIVKPDESVLDRALEGKFALGGFEIRKYKLSNFA